MFSRVWVVRVVIKRSFFIDYSHNWHQIGVYDGKLTISPVDKDVIYQVFTKLSQEIAKLFSSVYLQFFTLDLLDTEDVRHKWTLIIQLVSVRLSRILKDYFRAIWMWLKRNKTKREKILQNLIKESSNSFCWLNCHIGQEMNWFEHSFHLLFYYLVRHGN